MRRWVLAGILLGALVSVLWLRRPSDPLAGLGPEEALRLANRWAFSRPEVTSYLTDRRLVFRFPDGRERSVALPRDRMVVAVAPYLRATHPCRVHFPSSCRGELAGARFFVRVTETGGPVFFEGELRALKNGFFELWLPRDRRFLLEVVYQGYRGSLTLDTGEDAVTCRTDLKLARF